VSITLTFSFTACAGSTTLPTSLFHRFRIGDTPNFSANNSRSTCRFLVCFCPTSPNRDDATTAWWAVRFLAEPICGLAFIPGV
jgi:hypothetical protein